LITVQEDKGDEGADHGHLPLGKVKDLRGFIDDDHGNSQQRITGPNRQTTYNQLTKHLSSPNMIPRTQKMQKTQRVLCVLLNELIS
jgi:hypothetical protein